MEGWERAVSALLRTRFGREACLPTNGGVMSHTQEENGVSSPGSSSPSGGPEPELKYLARYTHRVAMTLEAVEFIRIGGAPRQRL